VENVKAAVAKSVGMWTVWFSEVPVTISTPCADVVINSMEDLVAAIREQLK